MSFFWRKCVSHYGIRINGVNQTLSTLERGLWLIRITLLGHPLFAYASLPIKRRSTECSEFNAPRLFFRSAGIRPESVGSREKTEGWSVFWIEKI